MGRAWDDTALFQQDTNSPAVGTGAAFAIVYWFRMDDNSGGSDFVGSFTEGGDFPNGNSINHRNSGALTFDYRNADSELASITSSAGFDDDAWHWAMAVKRASNDYELFVDGTSEGTDTTDVDPAPVLDRWQIKNSNAAPSGGMLGPFWAFDQALTIEQGRMVAYLGRCGVTPVVYNHLGMASSTTTAEPNMTGDSAYDVTPGSAVAFADSPPMARPFGLSNGVLVPVTAAAGATGFPFRRYYQMAGGM